ncbi:hypothetical protein ACFQS3_06600 [Glycomyces mayteni]|uniref:Uncharacterized protein n=1 Tax=Glycomyces mayteni TaxID=543887 RepID=A0ABW2D410_9ACTN|nr:hypothetical protein GCM10025732_22010 [Glycomyces mayteni]
MSKGLRVLLQLLQVLFALAALGALAVTVLMAQLDYDGPGGNDRFIDTWLIGAALLAIAFSPALWSLNRGGSAAPVAASSGSFDRAAPAPAAPQQPGKPGGVFEPMNPAAAPAAPASSYGQPSAGFGSQPQGESPWGQGR